MNLNEAKEILKLNGFICENKLGDYFLDKVYRVAEEIFVREISDHAPSLDSTNKPDYDYLQRFDYLSDDLKAAVKRAAIALKHELEEEGFDIHVKNVETEIYDALKLFAKE